MLLLSQQERVTMIAQWAGNSADDALIGKIQRAHVRANKSDTEIVCAWCFLRKKHLPEYIHLESYAQFVFYFACNYLPIKN